MLLTLEDINRRSRYRNAYHPSPTAELGVVPVINENDTVATSEIRFGDNDRLAALVAHLVHADRLVLLSDVDGLYDRHPGRRRIPINEVPDLDELGYVDVNRIGLGRRYRRDGHQARGRSVGDGSRYPGHVDQA